MKALTPVIFIVATAALFFGFINPQYQKATTLSAKKDATQKTVQDMEDLRQKRDSLNDKKNKISEENLSNLDKLLPVTVDNVSLILDISRIADNEHIKIKNIAVEQNSDATASKGASTGGSKSTYGVIKISFSVSSSYDVFLKFLDDLERSMRLVDIVELSVNANKGGMNDYNVKIQTYWLR